MQEIHIQCPYCLQAISIVLNNEIFGHNSQIDSCKKCNKEIEISYIVENKKIKTYSYNSVEGDKF